MCSKEYEVDRRFFLEEIFVKKGIEILGIKLITNNQSLNHGLNFS
jgi:hypothetical protein